MQRALWILSLLALVVLVAAIAGQALIYSLGIYFGPDGQPVDPSPLNEVVTIVAAIGGIVSMPVALATAVLGFVVTGAERRNGWLAAIIVATVVAMVGLVGMAWVILSVASPFAFQTPLLVIPLVTVAYCISARKRDVPHAAMF